MPKYSYDLHLHSCLSPCGDEDMTPANIVGMAAIKELDIIAVTDHNCCLNCEAVMEEAKEYGILVVPGMELTTKEEVHVLCLFEDLENAINFNQYVYSELNQMKNRVEIFGRQEIYLARDKKAGEEEMLLIQSTRISFDYVYSLVNQYKGIMIPAHIDKNSHSLLYNLGFIPPDSLFTCVEIKDKSKQIKLCEEHSYLKQCNIISNSDAHYLRDINEAVNHIELEEKSVQALFQVLNTIG